MARAGRDRTIRAALIAGVALLTAAFPAVAVAQVDEYPASAVETMTLGGSGYEAPVDTGTDAAGNLYVIGYTRSADFPIEGGLGVPFGPNPGYLGYQQGFVTKFDPGGEIVYSTYLPMENTMPEAAAVAPDGSVYVASGENEPDSDINVLKIAPSGKEILYWKKVATEGSSFPTAIDVDAGGRAVVTAQVGPSGFPVTADARLPQPSPSDPADPYLNAIMRLGPGGAIAYASYLEIGANSVEVADGGRVYAAGSASPGAFGKAPGTPHDERKAYWDGAVARYSPSLTKLDYGSFVGGSGYDVFLDVAVDGRGRAYAVGQTDSSRLGEVEPLDPASAPGRTNVLYAELSPDGTEIGQLARLGGSGGTSLALDVEIASGGTALVAGYTDAETFPSHGAPAGDIGPSAALAFRVEGRQLTHSTAYVNDFRSDANGIVPVGDGRVQVIGSGTPEGSLGNPMGPGEVFVTTMRLDPFVDEPQIALKARQRVGGQPAVKLRAGAREDVRLRAKASLAVKAGGRLRTVFLRSPRGRAEGYEKATLKLKPVSRTSARLLRKAVAKGARLPARIEVGFRDRGGAAARKRAKVTLLGGR